MTNVSVDSCNSLGKGKLHLKTKKMQKKKPLLRIFKKNIVMLTIEILTHPSLKKTTILCQKLQHKCRVPVGQYLLC